VIQSPMQRLAGCVVIVLVLGAGAWPARADTVERTISEVTLYRGQAQVTRTIEVAGDAGPREMVVTGLPQHVVGNSLFAEGADNVEVRAVRYRRRAVGEEPREQIRQLDAEIREVNDRANLVGEQLKVLAEAKQYLDKLEGFVAPTAQVELSQGVLDAEALKSITEYNFEKRVQIVERTQELQIEQRELKQELSKLQRQRSDLTRGSSRTVHEAVLFIEKADNNAGMLQLSYLVNECGWTPTYNFRGDSEAERVTLEYNAVIRQMSGEDWSNVKLRLSTATPALSAAVPSLAPFHVTLARGDQPQANQQPQSEQVAQYKSKTRQQQRAVADNTAAVQIKEFNRRNWDVNAFGNDIQIMELTVDKAALETLRQTDATDADEPSISYELPNRVSLASRSDQQMVRIIESQIDSQFYFVAAPVLSPHVFRQAELQNTTENDLLGGEASVYLDGRFVGRTELPTVARRQTFVVGFGADPQLRSDRELIDRDSKTQGGNEVLTAKYRLTVENYMDHPAPVRLKGRVPYAGMGNQVRVTLGDMTDKLSDDPLYERLEKPKGILRWDLEVAADASGEDARLVEYEYQLEYDRNLMLRTPGAEANPAMQQEFEQLRNQMLKH